MNWDDCNPDYKIEIVVKENSSEDYLYFVAFRSIMKPYEKANYDFDLNSENLEQLHNAFESLMGKLARFHYKELQSDKGLVSIEFMG